MKLRTSFPLIIAMCYNLACTTENRSSDVTPPHDSVSAPKDTIEKEKEHEGKGKKKGHDKEHEDKDHH